MSALEAAGIALPSYDDVERAVRALQDIAERTGMPFVLSVANRKGGISKTTTALALAYEFVRRGLRIMVIDTDDQPSATYQLLSQADAVTPDLSACQLLLPKPDAPAIPSVEITHDQLLSRISREQVARLNDENVVVQRHWRRLPTEGVPPLSFVPGHEGIRDVEGELRDQFRASVRAHEKDPNQPVFQPEMQLSRTLTKLHGKGYHVVIIDTPPSQNFGLFNSLQAANGLIMPLNFDRYGVRSYTNMRATFQRIQGDRERAGAAPLHMLGVLLTMFLASPSDPQVSTVAYQNTILQRYRDAISEPMFQTIVPYDPNVGLSSVLGVPVQVNDPTRGAGRAFGVVADEVLVRMAAVRKTSAA